VIAVRVEFPYLKEDTDRHGNVRIYVRRGGCKIRIREPKGSADFARAYAEAVYALDHPGSAKAGRGIEPAAPGTLGALAASYFKESRKFKALDPKSQTTRRLIIEDCLREPRKPGSKSLMSACPTEYVTPAVVMMLMDRKIDAGLPGAANNRKKYLSAMFTWAVREKLMKSNPARDAERASYATDGFHTWSVDEVRQFEARHPVGTKARLALALLLFTGSRRGDVVTFGRQHVKDGTLRFVPRKTRYKRMTASEKPWLRLLAGIVDATTTGDLTFLVTEYGKPFTAAGFGCWFRDRCDEAGLPQCSAHGLRKAGATIAAENGATDRQLMAMFDWSTSGQANVYTAAANKKRLAREASNIMVGHFEKEEVAHLDKKA
jgi:integrase